MHAPDDSHYIARQDVRESQYRDAWKDAPPSFREQAAKLGIDGAEVESESRAIEYQEGYSSASFTPDMGDLDTEIDQMIEEHGPQHESVIRRVVERMNEKMHEEVQKQASATVVQIVCYLIKTESGSLLARIHSLLHAIPRLAAINGYASMRQSAKACGRSVEWISRGRELWCKMLGIPIPAEGTKSEEAKAKYREAALSDHWRDRKFTADKTETNPNLCKPTPPKLSPKLAAA